jgi:hypothetical protein
MSWRKKIAQSVAQNPKLSKCTTFTEEKSSPIIWATFVIFEQLPKVKKHPTDEHSPNLVTLLVRLTTPTKVLHKKCQVMHAFQTPRPKGGIAVPIFCSVISSVTR